MMMGGGFVGFLVIGMVECVRMVWGAEVVEEVESDAEV